MVLHRPQAHISLLTFSSLFLLSRHNDLGTSSIVPPFCFEHAGANGMFMYACIMIIYVLCTYCERELLYGLLYVPFFFFAHFCDCMSCLKSLTL